MSTIDQCPSTKGKIEIDDARPETVQDAAGRALTRRYWKSAEDLADDPEFRSFVHREFPAGASELAFAPDTDGEPGAGESRRGFLKLMGASLALAGAATIPGCRRPDHQIVPYTDEPEHVVPGKPLYFATSMPLAGGGAEGLLVETHQGRPTKVEGNPLHPSNRGKSSVWSQASILETYDPDRLKFPVYDNPARGRLEATWDDFRFWWGDAGKARASANGGAGLAIVCDKKTSPTLDAMRARVMSAYPRATWVWWDAADRRRNSIDGTRTAFGSPRRVLHEFDRDSVVLSLDADFLSEGPNQINEARAFGASRRVEKSGEAMSRLYVCEAHPSGTGSLADHRWRMAPSQITAFAAEVARLLLGSPIASAIPASPLDDAHRAHAESVAADLRAAGSHAVVIAGDTQPAAVHALAAAINSAMGTKTRYLAMSETEASDPAASIEALAGKLNDGAISTLVTINANPVVRRARARASARRSRSRARRSP
jgi:MoCo/4Fe-4S cofactor protein with predicted Tat translocation signal